MEKLIIFNAFIDLSEQIFELKVYLFEFLILLVRHQYFTLTLKYDIELFAKRSILYDEFIPFHFFEREETQRVQYGSILLASFREKWYILYERHETFQGFFISDFHWDP